MTIRKTFSRTMTFEKVEREFKSYVYNYLGAGVEYVETHEGYLEGYKDGKYVAKLNRSRTAGEIFA